VTITLAQAARRIEVPPTPGLSRHAVRHVLATMAQVAQEDGTMLYGMAASKLANLTDFSEGLVRRAQRWLVAHGYLEREKVGGGRAATKWRVVASQLFRPAAVTEPPAAVPTSPAASTGQPGTEDRALNHTQVVQGFSPPNPRAAGAPSPSTSSTPPAASGAGRCEHGRTSCRRCRTSPRWRARSAATNAEQAGRACPHCVAVGASRRGGSVWLRVAPGTRTPLTPDQLCDHTTPAQHNDQHDTGSGRAAAMAFARALPATRAHVSRRDWRGRSTT
jgi:hypothetical protein